MSELAPVEPNETYKMTSVIGVGGIFSIKQQWPYYTPLLSGQSPLSLQERFLAIPDKGFSSIPHTYDQLEEQFLGTHEAIDERVVLAGHSLGGLMVTMLGLNHPDKISDVVCIAGAQDGVKRWTPSGKILRHILRSNSTGVDDIRHCSDFMLEHREKIATEWSPDTSLHLISPTYDDLLPLPQGLGLELPEDQEPERLMKR